jgi:hypothetical protein
MRNKWSYGVSETISYVSKEQYPIEQKSAVLPLQQHSNPSVCVCSLVTIESTGSMPPEVLFTEAVKILEEKCARVISELS